MCAACLYCTSTCIWCHQILLLLNAVERQWSRPAWQRWGTGEAEGAIHFPLTPQKPLFWLSVSGRDLHGSVPSSSLVHLLLQPSWWPSLIGHIYPWLPWHPLALLVCRGGCLTNQLYLCVSLCVQDYNHITQIMHLRDWKQTSEQSRVQKRWMSTGKRVEVGFVGRASQGFALLGAKHIQKWQPFKVTINS